ncbi:hypothetical protein FRB90_008871 [Tulasnella sp. 427]|nr:hypothetical protein FRB90_008871 [Tulasnella sp. 427]
MSDTMIYSRDVGRSHLPGLDLPSMQIEFEPYFYLRDEHFKAPFCPVMGIVHISPSSMTWYDGSILNLAHLTVTVQATPGNDTQPSYPFSAQESYDLTLTSRTKRYRQLQPVEDRGQCIQFGSTLTDTSGSRCPIALRIPTAACVPNGTRSFMITARATYTRLGPPTFMAPAQVEINAEPFCLTFAQA